MNNQVTSERRKREYSVLTQFKQCTLQIMTKNKLIVFKLLLKNQDTCISTEQVLQAIQCNSWNQSSQEHTGSGYNHNRCWHTSHTLASYPGFHLRPEHEANTHHTCLQQVLIVSGSSAQHVGQHKQETEVEGEPNTIGPVTLTDSQTIGECRVGH